VSRFLLARDGAFTTFDPPGSIFTIPTAINSNNGAVTGYYFDASFAIHGIPPPSTALISSASTRRG
jgi:hypothetical protein